MRATEFKTDLKMETPDSALKEVYYVYAVAMGNDRRRRV
jgi:hypothetical protein